MTEIRRNHPLMMVHELGKSIKNSLFFFIFLFIFNAGSEAWFFVYGRYAVVILFSVTLLSIPVKWYTRTYKLKDTSIQITRNFITTTKQTVPYSKVQHVRRKTYWFHRFFDVTSISLETSIQGEESSILFPVIKKEEANTIEAKIQMKKWETDDIEEGAELEKVSEDNVIQMDGEVVKESSDSVEADDTTTKSVHFTPEKKDVLKASVASLSFLAAIPLVGSLVSKLDDLKLEEEVTGFLSFILESTWIVTVAAILFVLISVVIGMVSTVMKYGKYEVASNDEKVIVTKGVMEEDYFSIEKRKVQAVLIEQSLMKRLLGLASLKLVYAGGSAEDSEVSSLYPFLPVRRAYSLVEEILPEYRLSEQMEKLPTKALSIRLLKPSWLWMLATALLFWLKPDIFGFTPSWWGLSLTILVGILISRTLNFYQSRFTMRDEFVQFQSGGFTKTLYLSRRDKIIEMEATRTSLQRIFGLASLNTVNRANPVRYTAIEDVPDLWVTDAYKWYLHRDKEIKIQ